MRNREAWILLGLLTLALALQLSSLVQAIADDGAAVADVLGDMVVCGVLGWVVMGLARI